MNKFKNGSTVCFIGDSFVHQNFYLPMIIDNYRGKGIRFVNCGVSGGTVTFANRTFEKDVLEIYETVTLNSRSEKLSVVGPGDLNETFTEFPATIAADAPGLYTVTQTPISGQQIVENFFVTIPPVQSNIVREVDSLTNPYYPPTEDESAIDFMFYFALAVVAILFLEWWLKSRENN